MSIFRRAAQPGKATGGEVRDLNDRDRPGPLPVLRDPVVMATRLSAERARVVEARNSCCLVVCRPNPVQGWTTEQTVAETATRFANSLRGYDSIFRHGSDTLVVCLPFVRVGDARSVMERLRDLAGRMPVDLPNGTSGHITVWLGGTMMDRFTDVRGTIDRAARAMEQGRLSGERICLWTPDIL